MKKMLILTVPYILFAIAAWISWTYVMTGRGSHYAIMLIYQGGVLVTLGILCLVLHILRKRSIHLRWQCYVATLAGLCGPFLGPYLFYFLYWLLHLMD